MIKNEKKMPYDFTNYYGSVNFRDGAKSSNNLHKLCNKINKEEYL